MSTTHGRIAYLDKDVSRLAMGCDNQEKRDWAFEQFDDFHARGGNCYDTAYIYGAGYQERLLGEWMKTRGVREQTAVIVKGCHPPHTDPASMKTQLAESLDRLGIERADLYMMHRDNLQVPIDEWISALNDEAQAGRISAFGGSNWQLERIQAGNDYARSNGLQPFSMVSNNFSLARMVDPVWGGCVSASDAKSRAWLTQNNFPVMSWSSQARGFFVRASETFTDDKELVRCWYAPDNFQRLERAQELAAQKGVEPINIAAAYVLTQPFPTFALIGPRTIPEAESSFRAFEVELTAQEVAYLNLEADVDES